MRTTITVTETGEVMEYATASLAEGMCAYLQGRGEAFTVTTDGRGL